MVNIKPKITGIFICRQKGSQDQVKTAILIKNQGLDGDVHAGHDFRQVSLLSDEITDNLATAVKKGLCTERFAPNLVTSGIGLHKYEIGTRFKIDQCLLEITHIGKSCFPNCSLAGHTGDCTLKTGAVFARVLKGGEIKSGSNISLI